MAEVRARYEGKQGDRPYVVDLLHHDDSGFFPWSINVNGRVVGVFAELEAARACWMYEVTNPYLPGGDQPESDEPAAPGA